MTQPRTNQSIDSAVRIGHIHLKVANLEKSIAFYSGILGFEVTQRLGSQAAFLSAGGYHHHIGLNTWESLGGSPPPRGHTGLYHVAIVYPGREQLADALKRLLDAGIRLDGASDPDDNGVELYWDRPKEQWPKTADGHLSMYTRPLDLRGLLAETSQVSRPERIPDSTGPKDL